MSFTTTKTYIVQWSFCEADESSYITPFYQKRQPEETFEQLFDNVFSC